MKLLNSAFNIVTLLVVGVVSIFVPVLISSWFGLDMFNPFTWINLWITYSTIILVASIVIFFVLKRSSVFKSSILIVLSAVALASVLFSVFAWFYFPHINEKGFEACKSLAFKLTLYDGGENDDTGKTFTFAKDLKLNKGGNLGSIDTFIKENGKPINNDKLYTYISKNDGSCSLTVDDFGVIQKARWVIP